MPRLSHISITNMRRFESYEADLPVICLLQGKNGEGKTTIKEAITYTFGRGHLPDIVKVGADAGECILTLDDGSQVKCRASLETGTTTRSYKAAGSKRFVPGRAEIDAMANAIGYDPFSLMDLDSRALLDRILEIAPLSMAPEEIEAAVGDAKEYAARADLRPGMNPLDIIRVTGKVIYDARRDINSAATSQEKYVGELEKAIGGSAEEKDWGSEVAALRGEKETIEKAQVSEVNRIGQQLAKDKEAATDVWRGAVEVVDAEINEKVKALEAERNAHYEKLRSMRDNTVEQLRVNANTEANAIRSKNADALTKLTADIATAEEKANASARAIGTRQAIDIAKTEAATKRATSESLTAALDRLKGLRDKLAKQLKIPGVTFGEDGRVNNPEGVPFDSWNTAAQMTFCLRVAVMAHGPAGFICLDGVERFDKDKRHALMAAAQKYAETEKLQFIISRVDDGPLKILDGMEAQ